MKFYVLCFKIKLPNKIPTFRCIFGVFSLEMILFFSQKLILIKLTRSSLTLNFQVETKRFRLETKLLHFSLV